MIWGTIISAVIAVVAGVASYTKSKKEADKAKRKAAENPILLTQHNNNAPLRIIYGQRAVGAIKTWKDISGTAVVPAGGRTTFGQNKDTADASTSSNKWQIWLDRVDVIGQGPIESVENIELDGDFYTHERFARDGLNHYRGIFMDGAENQANLAELTAVYPEWKSTALGRGVAYMNNRFRFANDVTAFSGDPDVTMHVKGKLVWDPRKDTNYGGTGTHDLNDESTWEWSDNPSLCLLDYLMASYGRNLPVAKLDIDSFKTAADSCDVLVTVPERLKNTSGGNEVVFNPITGIDEVLTNNAYYPHYRPYQSDGPSETTQKRLTCNIVLDTSIPVKENCEKILDTMKANLPYEQGKYYLRLEDVASSVMTLTEDDILPGITFGDGDRSERLNRVTVKYPNRNKRYKEDQVSWPLLSAAQYTTYLNEDNGEELHQTIELSGVTDAYQAEDIAEFIVRDSRNSLGCEITAKSKAIMLQAGDVVGVTHSTPNWSAKLFRVRGKKINSDLTVTLSLAEYQGSTYTWNAKSNEPDQPTVNLPHPFSKPGPLVNLNPTVGQLDNDTGVPYARVTVSWDDPASQVVDEYVIRYKISTESDWYVTKAIEGDTDVSFVVPRDNATYDIEVHYRNYQGQYSDVQTFQVVVPSYGRYASTTFRQTTAPVPKNEGDLWFDTDDNNKEYRCSSVSPPTWVSVADSDLSNSNRTYYVSSAPSDPPYTLIQGDLWFDTDDGNREYRYNGIVWVDVQDGDIVTAQITADGKIVSFYSASVPTAEAEGDLWFDTDDNNKPYRWNGSSWVAAQDGDISIAQTTADGKNTIFVQTSAPTPNKVEDLWFDSDDNYKPYRWTGSVWSSVQDGDISIAQTTANGAQTTADGKNTIFTQTSAPTANKVDDLWFDSDDNHKPYRWNGSVWSAVQDGDIIVAQATADNAQTTADTKNTTFYQTTPPTAIAIGDLWYDVDDGFLGYRWNGSSWVNIQDADIQTAQTTADNAQTSADNAQTSANSAQTSANTAQATADTKIQTFVSVAASVPSANTIGDYWYQTDTKLLLRANAIGTGGWTLTVGSTGAPAGTTVGSVPVELITSPPANLVHDPNFIWDKKYWQYPSTAYERKDSLDQGRHLGLKAVYLGTSVNATIRTVRSGPTDRVYWVTLDSDTDNVAVAWDVYIAGYNSGSLVLQIKWYASDRVTVVATETIDTKTANTSWGRAVGLTSATKTGAVYGQVEIVSNALNVSTALLIKSIGVYNSNGVTEVPNDTTAVQTPDPVVVTTTNTTAPTNDDADGDNGDGSEGDIWTDTTTGITYRKNADGDWVVISTSADNQANVTQWTSPDSQIVVDPYFERYQQNSRSSIDDYWEIP